MKYSIIIPVYNRERDIERCVESLIRRDGDQDYEIILADDGSKDCSLDICRKLAGRHGCVRVIAKENGGVSSARNEGLANAVGDFVAFVDSDDFVKDTYWRQMEEAASHNADVSVFGFTHWQGPDQETPGRMELPEGYHESIDCLTEYIAGLEHCVMGVWSMLYKRAVIEKTALRFRQGMGSCEDFLFNLQYFSSCESVFVSHGRAYCYVQNPHSVTHNRPLSHADDYDTIYSALRQFLAGKQYDENLLNRRLTRWMIDLTANWKQQGITNWEIRRKLSGNRLYTQLTVNCKAVGAQWSFEQWLLKRQLPAGILWYMTTLGKLKSIRKG